VRVLYDHQAFLQTYGGVSRYFAEIIRAMGRLSGFEALLPRFFSDNRYLESKNRLFTSRPFKGKVRLMDAANRLLMCGAFRGRFDLFHPTYFRPYFFAPLGHRPFVVTIHDMIHELFPDRVRDDGTRENKSRLCRQAAGIIAVSENTRNDVCRILGIPEGKVAVIHHATTLTYRGEPRLHQRPYMLYVGERSGYKNFAFLLESAAGLLIRHDVDMLCAGGGSFSLTERRHIEELGVADKVSQTDIAGEAALASLYKHAALLCFPSLYEGFGFPLIEAFSCGCPSVASSSSCFREIAGEAAEYFDPGNRDSIARALERVLLDAPRTRELVALGTERVRRYSWETAAAATLEVYRAAVG
jgi:glycosyltransferase involved in cell wall biosynthesis